MQAAYKGLGRRGSGKILDLRKFFQEGLRGSERQALGWFGAGPRFSKASTPGGLRHWEALEAEALKRSLFVKGPEGPGSGRPWRPWEGLGVFGKIFEPYLIYEVLVENSFRYRAHRGCYRIRGCAEAGPARSVCLKDSRGKGARWAA